MKYKAAEEAGSSEVSENRNNKVEDVAGKMPQTDSEKENAPGRKGIPDNVAMNVDGGAQENTHGTVSAYEGEIKEKLGLQEGDSKCSIPMDGKDKPVDGEIMENGKVNPMGPADAVSRSSYVTSASLLIQATRMFWVTLALMSLLV